jgi:hypothetical protein
MRREIAYDFGERITGLRFLEKIGRNGFRIQEDPSHQNQSIHFKDNNVGRILSEQYLIIYTSFPEQRMGEKEYATAVSKLIKLADESG